MTIFRNLLVYLLLATFVFSSCTSQKEKDEKSALHLLTEATEQVKVYEHSKALQLLDSLHKNYPMQVSIRRQADQIQDTIEWRISKKDLKYCDSLLLIRNIEFENLKKNFKFVKNEKYEALGQYLHHNFSNEILSSNINSYIDEDGKVFLKCTYTGPKIGINQIVFKSGSKSLKSPVGGDGNYHQYISDGQNFEQLIISGESAKAALVFLTENKNIQCSLNGKSDILISVNSHDAFVQSSRFAQIYTEILNLNKETKRLNNKIFTIEAK